MHPAQVKDTLGVWDGGAEGKMLGWAKGEKQEAGQAPWSEEIHSHSRSPTCRQE